MMQIMTRKPTLVDILNNETSYPYSLDDFATFLDQTYCLENLEFYLAVRRYTYYAYNFYNYSSSPLSSVGSVESDSFFESPSLLSVVDPTITYYDDDASLRGDAPAHLDFLKQKLHELITTFILPNSPKEVNIPAETRDDLLTNVFQFNNYHPSIFDQVKEHIYELMESSSFTQFLIEAGNVELRMSSESECQEDSDHSSVSGGKDASSKKNNNKSKNSKHTRRFSGLKLKEKYRKLLKTTTNTSSKSRNSLLL